MFREIRGGQRKLLAVIGFLLFFVLTALFFTQPSRNNESEGSSSYQYPAQDNRRSYQNAETSSYRIGVIADMDKKSHVSGHSWRSYLKEGTLIRDPETGYYSVRWDSGEPTSYYSTLNEAGRSMELSALADFNHKLLAFDDRTGVAFELYQQEAIPTYIFMDGDGRRSKGLKTEWATVKLDKLYVGSTGKEWTNSEGVVENYHPLWVKQVALNGHVAHLDWSPVYNKIRKLLDAEWPGYVLHEAVIWNNLLSKWFFFPRRISKEMYDDVLDETRGSNMVISASESFEEMKVTTLGPLDPMRGFSAAQFIPFREDEVVVLKTEEVGPKIATYIAVYNLDGTMLMPETYIENIKYEGLEFLHAS